MVRNLLGEDVYWRVDEVSYVARRYSIMAPDSHSLMLVFGSSMAGTRPLGLMDSKGSAWVI